MKPLIFDTETHRFGPGDMAPRMVCVTWVRPGLEGRIRHARDARALFEDWIKGDELLVGHNVAYDLAVVCRMWPELIPAVFAKYDRDQITDTLIREQLLAIAAGKFRGSLDHNGEWKAMKFALDACYYRRTGDWLEKDEWRLRYSEFDTTPVDQWPEGARKYAIDDAVATLSVFASQETDRWLARSAVDSALGAQAADLLQDQFRQARAAFALHLSSCWGITVDPAATSRLEAALNEEFDEAVATLQAAGIVRANGTADTKAAQACMAEACQEQGLRPLMTKGGALSLASDWCEEVAGDEDSVRTPAQEIVACYSKFLTLRKKLSNDIEMLHKGILHARYGLAESGRTTCRGGVQTTSRAGGIRECFRPRPGTVFAQADYEGLELHTLAQWCESTLKPRGVECRMGNALRAGQDLHLVVAADMLGNTYEETSARLKAGDKAVKEARQQAKPINFGRPGGLGDARYVDFAKKAYGVAVTLEEARAQKQRWMQLFPEMQAFFDAAAEATATDSGLGAEWTLFSNRFGTGITYSALCNRRFQGLGSDAAKAGLWLVTRACYAEPASPLYGCRVVAFIHDELLVEVPDEPARADAAARELSRLMVEGARKFLPDVTPKAPPTLQRAWSKDAKALYDAQGRLVPWAPEEPALLAA